MSIGQNIVNYLNNNNKIPFTNCERDYILSKKSGKIRAILQLAGKPKYGFSCSKTKYFIIEKLDLQKKFHTANFNSFLFIQAPDLYFQPLQFFPAPIQIPAF